MNYKQPKFRTVSGDLTAYALACGYVQVAANGWTLYKDGCYHIHRSVTEWITVDSLVKAKAIFKAKAKEKGN